MCPKQDITNNLFVGFEMHTHFIVFGFNVVVFFVVPNEYAMLTEVITQGVDDFIVEIREQLASGVDEVDSLEKQLKARGESEDQSIGLKQI